jgi:hypothetical protein
VQVLDLFDDLFFIGKVDKRPLRPCCELDSNPDRDAKQDLQEVSHATNRRSGKGESLR